MQKYSLLFQLLIAFVLAFVITSFYFSGERKFDQLALGTETIMYQAVDQNKQLIHISRINNDEQSRFVNAYNKRGKKKVILFFGNSQTHSINQKKDSEVNFIQILYDRFQKDSTEILCHSLPNANLQEFCLSYFYWKDKLKLKSIVLPVFFDDLREDGIRDVFFPALVSRHFLLKDSTTKVSKKINTELENYWPSAIVNSTPKKETGSAIQTTKPAEIRKTTQEQVENKLNGWLEKNVKIWNNRENVRGDFFVWIYQLRNTILRIHANTVRKMIPQRYEDNMEALTLLLNDCIKSKIKVLLYIPPIRSDASLPYDYSSYTAFKATLKNISLANDHQVFFCDYGPIIPGYLWGYKGSTNLLEKREIDYMHFKYKGHQILADSLFNQLKYIQ
ncbi:MAG: hypothetical protein ABIN24_13760 [Dyadobacter sp.]